MSKRFEKYNKDFLFLPLGGSGEIGMNFNLYQYDGKWIIVDCGAGFAEDFLPGIDMIVPDISFIQEIKDDLLGIILTHAHEDHLGAVQYLWYDIGCPVYATPFTATFLEAKLADVSEELKRSVPIHKVKPGSSFEIGPFHIHMIGLTHSAPEMNALIVETPLGKVLHTGDWKFDPQPVIGPPSEEDKLIRHGDDGVLAIIGDSTNVFKDGHSGSEGDLQASLIELIGEAKRMVVVTTFASNLARIDTVARAAVAHNRKLVVVGRSLWRIIHAAKACGYLQEYEFLDDRSIRGIPRESILLLATGCQGEPLAVMNKLAKRAHPHLHVLPGDMVIFSSKIIPGNDKRIFRLFNEFISLGIEVITEKDHFVHVSGHPSKDELKKMMQLIRPQIVIPVHGERVHMHEHAKLAKSVGIPYPMQIENGDVIRLAPGTPQKVERVDVGLLGIDGYFLLAPSSPVMKLRRRMRDAGLVMVILMLHHDGSLKRNPIILTPGSLDPNEDSDVIELIGEEITSALSGMMPGKKGGGRKGGVSENIENITRAAVRRIMKAEVNKEPPVEVKIEWLT